ncbi:MAG: multiheme c-type cytochrome [Pirellulaceae bacterium]
MSESSTQWRWFQHALIVVTMLATALCFAVGCPAPSTPNSSEDPAAEKDNGQTAKPANADEPSASGEQNSEGSKDEASHSGEDESAEKAVVVDPAPIDPEAKKKASEEPEELFKDWPEPAYVLFLTGRQHGYIEPCGCTGLENQKGGLARRDTLLQQLRSKKWNVVPIDVGNQVRRFGRQPEIKFQLTVNSLQRMKYQAVGLGPDDLKLPAGELIALIAGDSNQATPFVAANVVVLDRSLLPEFQVIQVGDQKIGVTAVLADAQHKLLNNGDLILEPMVASLTRVWPKLAAAKCDFHLLLCYGSLQVSRQLARQFPQFQVVVTAGGSGPPTFEPEVVEPARNLLIQVGPKGMYAGALGIFSDPQNPLRYQRISLSSRFKDSTEMLDQLKSYQSELQRTGLTGLGLRPIAHASNRNFTGSQVCGDCHTKAYEIWKKTPHARATDSLIKPPERQDIARHFDPECLSCHVTGWNPQKYFPYQTGYWSLEKTFNMKGNGCENCHGPGSHHVAAESGDLGVDDQQRAVLRKQMQLTLADARQNKCMECHDLDNSPDFHDPGAFETYWKEVEHRGKD